MTTLALFGLLFVAAQEPSISLRTEPAGATVTVKGLKGVWTTPCEVPLAGLRADAAEIMIAKEGFETILRRHPIGGNRRVSISFKLAPRAAAVEQKELPKVAEVDLPRPVRLRVSGAGALRVTSNGKVVAEGPLKRGEPVELAVEAGKIRIEHLNAPGGSPTHTVEILPEAPGVDRRPGERVGQVQLVHHVYGVFLKLDPGVRLVPGEEIALFRNGREVARPRVLQVVGGDETYPDGAAQLTRSGLVVRKADEARRLK